MFLPICHFLCLYKKSLRVVLLLSGFCTYKAQRAREQGYVF